MIGKKLKKYRQQFRLTGTTLAKLAGINQPYLSEIENEKKVPPMDTFINLVSAISKVAPLNYQNKHDILTEENLNKFIESAIIKAHEIPDYPDKASITVTFNGTCGYLGWVFNKDSDNSIYEPMEPFEYGEEIDSSTFIHEAKDELKQFFFNTLDNSPIYDSIENLSDSELFNLDEAVLYNFPFIRESLYEWWYNHILQDIIKNGVRDNVIYADKEINDIDMPLSAYSRELSEGERRLLAELWPLMDENGEFTPYSDDDNTNISKDLLNGKTVIFDIRSITDKNVRALLDGQLLSNEELIAIKFALNGIRYNREKNRK